MPELITELVSWKPKIVLVGNHSTLSSLLKKLFEEMQFEVVQELSKPILEEAYKIVWVLNYHSKSDTEYQRLRFILHEFQKKTTIIAPVISGVKTLPDDVYKGWQDLFENQSNLILDCNHYFPNAAFVFGQNLVGDSEIKNPLDFFSENFLDSNLYDPEIKLSLLEVNRFAAGLRSSLFGSTSALNTLLRGPEIPSTTLLVNIAQKYQAYYQKNVEITTNSLTSQKTTPFEVVEKEIAQDYDQVAQNFAVNKLEEKVSEKTILKPAEKNVADSPISSVKKIVTPPPPPPPINEKPKSFSSEDEIEEELEKLFENSRKDQKITHIKKAAKKQVRFDGKSKRKKTMFYFGLSFIGAGLGFLFLIIVFFLSNFWVSKSLASSLEMQGPAKYLDLSTKILRVQTQSYGALLDLEYISQAEDRVELGRNILDSETDLEKIDRLTQQLTLTILGNSVGDLAQIQQELLGLAQRSYSTLSLVQATLDSDGIIGNKQATDAINQYKNKLNSVRKSLGVHQQLLPILPSLVGVEQRKTYAVLLQNEQELRSTGGFIQAVALLTFEQGQLINSQVFSVYELDDQLKGVVIAPDEVKTYLGEERLYLRDSNWSSDFPKSAERILSFVEDSTNQEVDGIVAINLHTVQKILANTSPLELTEYNEVITEKNLFERMEFHSEVILTNNTQTKDYSSTLLSALLTKIISLPTTQLNGLTDGLEEELRDHQAFVYLSNSDLQQTISSLGWGGELLQPDCPAQLSSVECRVSTIAQIESNIGVNKANYYLDRSVKHSVVIGKSLARHSRDVFLKNNATSNSWPKGAYSSYIRFYIDRDARLEGVSVDGKQVDDEQINQYLEDGRRVVGVLVNVPIAQERTLNISYSTPVPEEDAFSYALFNQVQSGTSDTAFELLIDFESGVSPTVITPAPDTESPLSYKLDGLGHAFVGVSVDSN